eukprot:TRINITY_DN40734_c0_g1_i1.p1 TRINITY_DN40734_c0_g1~~TRINITY_DN40734_c0_g1_i1.p1  ORF type:complete len:530 (-),score=86.26 TRINITY_DN40734_c0_g1_i1:76-1665(-)
MPAVKEVVHIQIGKAGNGIGHEFWRDLCDEHRLEWRKEATRGTYYGDHDAHNHDKFTTHRNVFFNEGSGRGEKARFVPRAILMDLNMQDLAQIAGEPLGELYRPENIIGNDEGSGNCYAKAFHTEGPDLADRCLESVRKEFERCDGLQGVQFVHSISGGTGSGLSGLMMKTLQDYLGDSKVILQSFCLCPTPSKSDMVTEPYNAALGFQDILDHTDMVFLFDNQAITDISQKWMEQDSPSFRNINNIIAWCMSGITCPLRFKGPLNADLRKMHTNLVPFQKCHFLISGFAPLTAPNSTKYRKITLQDLAQQMISKDSMTVKCDPLNPGDPREGVLRARFLACWASWRGDIPASEADDIAYNLTKSGSRYDKFFPDWIPNGIASNNCAVAHSMHSFGSTGGGEEHHGAGKSVTFISNNTAVHEVFDRVGATWDKFYDHKAYIHVYEQEGISQQDMMESRNCLQYISDQYCEMAQWDDQILKEMGGGWMIRESAIRTDEQQRIAQELKELGNGRAGSDMVIKSAPRGPGGY